MYDSADAEGDIVANRTVRRTKERLTVSLSRETREFISTEATARGTDQSSVVEDAVRRMFRDERRRLTQLALLETAELDQSVAEGFLRGDTTLDEYPWEE